MHYIFTTTAKVTEAAAQRINSQIKEIDKTAEFVGPLSIPGNQLTGWIERPNDGTNDHNHVRSRNQDMAAIAQEVLS